jgi:hypothetical protein
MNEDVSKLPVHPNSDNIVKFCGAGKKMHTNDDMCYIIVPPNQPRIDVKLRSTYESDKGPYPFPDTTPIEGFPLCGGTLDEIQRKGDGDRHALVIDPMSNLAYEFYNTRKVGTGWEAANCAIFDLASNKMRPAKWTSADAAGLSIFAGTARYDECERGMVEHAIRVTVCGTRKGYIYPATHDAAGSQDPNAPVMGQRLRLKAGVDISRFPPHAQAIAKGMKKYGLIVSDNGSSWFISICPDRRLKGLEALWGLKGTDFEFVQSTGPSEGPRAGQ